MKADESSLFRRLMVGFASVLALVTLASLAYVVWEAKSTQRWRTSVENVAHVHETLLHLQRMADQPAQSLQDLRELERTRAEMFRQLDYHSRVRLRVWKDGALVYNSAPQLPAVLPAYGTEEAVRANSWVSASESDAATGLHVERSHEVDDEWMLSLSGLNVLMSSTIFSLPLLLLPAWLIVGIGLRPLRSIATLIEQRDEFDLTMLPVSKYRELAPLVNAINRLLVRLRQRIEREHDFITDAAHELKTPLAAIQINSHVILSRCDAATRARCEDAANGLRHGVSRASHMVHQLLALERAHTESDVAAVVTMELSTFLRDRMALMAPLAMARAIEIEFDTDSTHAQALHLESMAALVDNLLSNAIKYSPDGASVAVHLSAVGEVQRLTISDEGPGIDPQLRAKVFERFYRVPGQEQLGSGLGLAIAARAATRNNARIELFGRAHGPGLTVQVDFMPSPAHPPESNRVTG